jgi:hypothetical protein
MFHRLKFSSPQFPCTTPNCHSQEEVQLLAVQGAHVYRQVGIQKNNIFKSIVHGNARNAQF